MNRKLLRAGVFGICGLVGVLLTHVGMAAQQKPVIDTGPYEVVPNWPQQIHKDWTWGRTGGIWAESPDRVYVLQLGEPTDIAFLPNGDFFVTDGYKNGRVVRFNKDGKYLSEFGKKGTGPGEFNVAHAIALDAQGRIFVSDRENKRIQIFDQSGKF